MQEQDRRPGRVGDLFVQLADLVAAAEEDLGMLGREPGQVPERALRQVALGEVRKAELGVASGVGEAPALDQLSPRAELPGEAVVVGRIGAGRFGRGAEIAVAVVRFGDGVVGGENAPSRLFVGSAEREAGSQLSIKGDGERAGHAIVDGPRRGDHGGDAGLK